MSDTIRQYCNANPVQRHHQKAGEKVAVARPPISAGWAWNPDEKTKAALARGSRKIRKAKLAALNPQDEETPMATKKATSKKRTTKKTARKVEKKTTDKSNGLMPLKKLCATLKIDTRLARRKLRANTAMAKIHAAKGRWEFTAAQAKKAKAVLSA